MRTLLVLVVFGVSPSVFAEESEPTIRVVVLTVPGGGTEVLGEKIDALEGVEMLPQAWFVAEVKKRGIKTKGLMKRSSDLKRVMQGAEVMRLVFVTEEDGARYLVTFLGDDGEARREFKLDQTEAGLDEAGADKVVAELKDDLGLVTQPQVQDVPVLDEPEVVEVKPEPVVVATGLRGTEGWKVEAAARLIKRDLGVNGANGAVLTYPSQFYPGGDFRFSYFPGGKGSSTSTGVSMRVIAGLASVSSAVDPGQTPESKPVFHLEGELLADHRVVLGRSGAGERDSVRFDLLGGARFVSFAIDQGALPATSEIALILGAKASTRALSPELTLFGGVQLTPFGMWLTGADAFGESSLGYGFGASFGGEYAFSETFGLGFGYEARFDRTSFSGQGSLDYLEAEAFELVQGVTLGVVYQN